MGVSGIIYWGVDKDVGTGVGSACEIKFGIDDGYDMDYFYGSFGGLNIGIPVVSLLDKTLELNSGTLLDLSEIDRYGNFGVRRINGAPDKKYL